ncbi:MAG: hypothetical protein ABSE76_02250 [Minisyncoccia bacterium]|jgi:hypothetical protein
MAGPSDEDLASSILKHLWRGIKPFKFTEEQKSKYITEMVAQYLQGLAWIPCKELVSKIEVVTHILRQRMAQKGVETKRKKAKQKKIEDAKARQYNLFTLRS